MELQLHQVEHDFYERVDMAAVTCETMRESIVPDSCADIARIVDTTGMVCLTSRDMMADGRFSVSGTVCVSVLYIPENGTGPCALHYQIPFQYSGEGQEGGLEHFDVHAVLKSVDTRLLNPRKVLTRVDIALHPTGCRRRKLRVSTGKQPEESGLQYLYRSCATKVIAAVREKEFSFVEEIPVTPGREGVSEILSTFLQIRCADSKLIGSKIVVKGMLSVRVLYRDTGGSVRVLQQELPFSQIMEGGGMEETWECQSKGQLLSFDCVTGSESSRGDDRVLTISVQVRTRAVVWRPEELELIADLYSTVVPVKTRMEEISLQEMERQQNRRVSGKELLETGVAVKHVVDVSVTCGEFQLRGGADGGEIPVSARCLYADENDMLHSVQRSFGLPCSVQGDEQCSLSGRCECCGEVMTAIMPEGIELRFPVDCVMESWRTGRYLCVTGVEAEDEETPCCQSPSLVLRKFDSEESLWSVAKQYRTTCRAILEANEIESEQQLPRDRLLLIPRARA